MARVYIGLLFALFVGGVAWYIDHQHKENQLLKKDVQIWTDAYKVAADIAVQNKETLVKMEKERQRTNKILEDRERALQQAERRSEEQHAELEALKRRDKDAERWLNTPVPDSVRNVHRAGRPTKGDSGEAVPVGESDAGHAVSDGAGSDQR